MLSICIECIFPSSQFQSICVLASEGGFWLTAYIYGSCFCIHSISLCLLVGTFNLFTFKVIINLPKVFFRELGQIIAQFVWRGGKKKQTSNSQSNLEKEEWNWRNHPAWLLTMLQSYSHHNSMYVFLFLAISCLYFCHPCRTMHLHPDTILRKHGVYQLVKCLVVVRLGNPDSSSYLCHCHLGGDLKFLSRWFCHWFIFCPQEEFQPPTSVWVLPT